jgi:glycosyltransferase involved in cell wall biosynthesis
MIAADSEISKTDQIKYSGYINTFAMQFVYNYSNVITAQTKMQFEMFYKNRKRMPDAIIKNIYLNETESSIQNCEKQSILWVGRLTEIKNPEIFFDLAKKYPNEHFVMIAPVVIEKREYGMTIRKIAGKINNLQYIEYVMPSEIKLVYQKTKVYVLTSDFEGFSNAMAEAMIHKCAVLSYNVNPDNILNEYQCGFCANKNLNKFYSDFEDLLNNYELRQQFGENGAKYICENHQKDVIIESFKKLLS